MDQQCKDIIGTPLLHEGVPSCLEHLLAPIGCWTNAQRLQGTCLHRVTPSLRDDLALACALLSNCEDGRVFSHFIRGPRRIRLDSSFVLFGRIMSGNKRQSMDQERQPWPG